MQPTAQKNTYLSLLAVITALTAVIWLTAGRLQTRFDVVNEKYYPFFYPWQTRNPTAIAYLSAWLGYALHNIAAWAVIWAAQRAKPKYEDGINEVIRIPFIEYLAVFIFYGLFMIGCGLKRLLNPIPATLPKEKP